MLGGVTVNLILGFFIYMMILFFYGRDELKPKNIPDGLAVINEMEQFGFRDGDNILSVNGKELDDVTDINRYLLVRDVSKVEVKRNDGSIEVLSLPDTIGNYIFKKGLRFPFTPRRSTIIDSVVNDLPAFKNGLKKGDNIVSINDKEINFFGEIKKEINKKPINETSTLVYERNNILDTISITPDEEGRLGVINTTFKNYNPVKKEYSFGEAITKGFSFGYWTLHDYVAQFKYVFTKKGATQLGGFGTIAKVFPPTWNWEAFWYSTALISIILAFMNILPIPALDGGCLLYTSPSPRD